jgi:hypothetical protein
MDLTPYVDHLRDELAVAAAAGGEDARALAERLTAPLDSAVRLTLLEALSAAAEEITRDLAPGSVELRLRGRDPGFVVTTPLVDEPVDPVDSAPPRDVAPPVNLDDGATSRINLRLPENLKLRIEEIAGREGLSVNAWLVRTAAAALEPDNRRTAAARSSWGGEQYTGWVR